MMQLFMQAMSNNMVATAQEPKLNLKVMKPDVAPFALSVAAVSGGALGIATKRADEDCCSNLFI